MDKENPFCAWILILICLFVYFRNVSSHAVIGEVDKTKDSLIDRIKFCATVNVIGNSSYVKSCETEKYTEEFIKDNINLSLCMLVYDTTSKICEYYSKVPTASSESPLLPSSSQQLDKEIEKFVRRNNNSDICKNISSIFNKLNHSKVEGSKSIIPQLEYTKTTLLTKDQCSYTCHSSDNKNISHLCTYLLWANEFFNSLQPIKVENKQEENLPVKDTKPKTEADVPEENHENNNENADLKVADVNEQKNKNDKIPNPVNKSENQKNKQKSPSSNKKSDDVQKQPKNSINASNNEPKNKPNDQKPIDESNGHKSLPVQPKPEDPDDVAELKKTEGEVDNSQQAPPEEVNQDGDSISAEDHQNKENNDHEEEFDQEKTVIDQKDSNNQGAEVVAKNPIPDDNDGIQQRQKYMPHSQSIKEEEESHFFTYFSLISLLCIVLYFGYHNKQKIFAILLEGRRSRRGRGSRRRPSTASYRKLDCNLEEAVTSQCNSNVTHVIY